MVFLLLAFSLQITTAYAELISSRELIDKAKDFDGKSVTYRGEAVTAIMKRADHSWVNLNDGDNAMGIWCRSSLLDAVKMLGDYKKTGDIVEVEGTFHRACGSHNGDMDIHADKVKILRPGFPVTEQPDDAKIALSITLFLLTLWVVLVFKERF